MRTLASRCPGASTRQQSAHAHIATATVNPDSKHRGTARCIAAEPLLTATPRSSDVWRMLLLENTRVSSSRNKAAEERVTSDARVSTSEKDFIPCPWTAPLAIDESPLYAWTAILTLDAAEASRTDMRSRARTKFLHHKAKSSQAPSKEMYWHQRAMQKSRARRYKEALSLLRKGARLFPTNPFFLHSAGALYHKLGRLDDAENSFKRALEVDPNNSVSMQALARVHAHRGNTAEARDLFKRAVEVDPGNAAAWQAWALLEREQGAVERACSLLREGMQINPDHEPSLHALAKLEIEQRHFKAARSLLQRTLRLNPFHPHSWTTLGELSYIEGFPEQARVVFNSMIMHCGGDAVVYSTWGGMESRMGEQSKARELLEKSIDLDPTNAHSWTQLTRLLTSDPLLHDHAEGAFLRALTACPGNTHILHVFSGHLLATGQTERAEEVLHSLAKKEPENGVVLHSLGLLELQRGNRLEAGGLFKRGIKSRTLQARLLCVEELARLSVLEGRPEVGRQLYKHASGWGTQLTSRFLREWGMFERRMGNSEHARSLLRQSVELRAMDIQSWIAWALLERSQHNLKETLFLLRQALSVAPRVATLWYLYCETATQCLSLEECREIFQEAFRLTHRSPQIFMLAAICEWREGNTDMARNIFMRGSRLSIGDGTQHGPLYEAWRQMEEQLNDREAADHVGQMMRNAEQQAQASQRARKNRISDISDELWEVSRRHQIDPLAGGPTVDL